MEPMEQQEPLVFQVFQAQLEALAVKAQRDLVDYQANLDLKDRVELKASLVPPGRQALLVNQGLQVPWELLDFQDCKELRETLDFLEQMDLLELLVIYIL